MSEKLTASDIDALLGSVRGKAEERSPARYDWTRPLLFTRENLKVLGRIHETWTRLCSHSLSRLLGTPVGVTVASLDQLTWEEFIRSVPGTGAIATVSMAPLAGPAVLQIDPAAAFPLLERLLGGLGERLAGRPRPLTLTEQSLMESVVIGLLGNLREAWSGLVDLKPRLADFETESHLVQLAAPSEPVALVTSFIRFGEVEGMLNFCLPWPTVAPLAEQLVDQVWYRSALPLAPETKRCSSMTVELGRLSVDPSALETLEAGAFFFLQKPYPSPLEVVVEERVVARGEVVVRDDTFGLRVTELVHPPLAPQVHGGSSSATITVCLGQVQDLDPNLPPLGVGQILALDTKTGQPLRASLEGQPYALVEGLVTGAVWGVRIRKRLSPATPPVVDSAALTKSIVEGWYQAMDETMTTIGHDEVTRPEPERRREIEADPDDEPSPPSAATSLENRSRALWCQRQIERNNPTLAGSLIATLTMEDAVQVVQALGEGASAALVVPLASWSLDPAAAVQAYETWKAANPLERQGPDQTRALMERVFGGAKAIDLLHRGMALGKHRPFGSLAAAPAHRLASVLGTEHPQTQAVVLAHLSPSQAATVLEKLEPVVLDDVIRRIAVLRPVSSLALREIERMLERLLLGGLFGDAEPEAPGGVAAVLGILDRGNPVTRRAILERLEESDPDLARRLRDE